jgi:hypothetical protein
MAQQSFSYGSAILLGLLIAAGVAIGGYFIGDGFYRARMGEQYVTVKGLVERDVKADLAQWTISYTAAGPDLNRANAASEEDVKLVMDFATAHGFMADEVEVQPAAVTDSFGSQYQNRQPDSTHRFIIKSGVRIRSSRVNKVSQASQDTGELVKRGVVLGESYPQAPQYFFTRLNDIRPAMLAEATRSARSVAEQFALDSRSRLGPIRRANQGVFEVTSRDASGDQNQNDEQNSIDKKVRLVSTVDYYLIN